MKITWPGWAARGRKLVAEAVHSGPAAPVERPAAPGRHFTWAEWESSGTAAKNGLDNTVPPEHWANVVATTQAFDLVRDETGRPLRLTSGYRTEAVNAAMPGASPTSDHRFGLAGDIDDPVLDAYSLASLVHRVLTREGIDYDQIIWYADKGHVHVGFGSRMRGSFLKSYVEDGKRHYPTSTPLQ